MRAYLLKDILTNKGKIISNSVFHYTTANSLISIIENKELWFTDRDFVNDVNDKNYIKELILKKVSLADPPPADFKGSILESLLTPPKQYIFSTSLESDLSHQWRLYGKTDGYCIKFNRSALEKAIKDLLKDLYSQRDGQDTLISGKVIYDEPSINKKLDYVKDFKEKLLRYMQTNDYWPQELPLLSKKTRELYALSKQKGNYAEKEYRFCLNTPIPNSFDVRNGVITPILKLKLSDLSSIEKIFIGPSHKDKIIAEDGLNRFLENKCSDYQIVVDKSEMEFR